MSTTTFILFVYLSTWSSSSGMTITSAEFHTQEACESAGAAISSRWGTIYTKVGHYCARNSRPAGASP